MTHFKLGSSTFSPIYSFAFSQEKAFGLWLNWQCLTSLALIGWALLIQWFIIFFIFFFSLAKLHWSSEFDLSVCPPPGSGKSYTMMGSSEQPGLIPRLCSSLFDRTLLEQREGESFTVEVSFMEIYNEKVRDLLDPKGWGEQELSFCDDFYFFDFIHIKFLKCFNPQ